MIKPALSTIYDAISEKLLLVILSGFVVIVFLIGGGARHDITSLILLRPLSAIVLAISIPLAFRAAWRNQWQPIALILAIDLLTLTHLIPLPPSVWTTLPGRDVVEQVYRATGQPLPWLPVSIAPLPTWNALFSLIPPTAAMLLALALPTRHLTTLLKLLLVLGLVSALLGLLQVIGPMNGPLYPYRITNNGNAVGLFANRNHHAIFLATLFPLLAASAATATGSKARVRLQRVMAVSAGAFLVPLLLVTGSRAGLALGMLGLLACFWVYRPQLMKRTSSKELLDGRRVMLLLVGGMLLLGLVTVLASRASAFQRLVDLDAAQDLRFRTLPIIWDATLSFFPVGSGIGSFVEAYEIFEPDTLLSANYLNHAHNDILEALMVGGLPALLLMIAAGTMATLAAWRLATAELPRRGSSHDSRAVALILGRAGIAGLLVLALGSVVDYPLRAPSLAVVSTLYVAFAAAGAKAALRGPRLGRSKKV